jgi:4-hydroxybenzoate polyprenyltransferase
VVCLGGYSVLTDTGGFGGFPLNVLAALLVSLTLGLNVKDVRDAAGDRMTGVVTLPGLLGERKGRIVTGCLAMAAYLSVPVLLGPRWLLLPGAAAGGATFALLLGQKLKEAPIFMVYFAFIACVGVSLFVGV